MTKLWSTSSLGVETTHASFSAHVCSTSCATGVIHGQTVVSVFSPDDGQTLTDLCCSGSRPCFLCAVDREYGQGAPTDVSPHLISNRDIVEMSLILERSVSKTGTAAGGGLAMGGVPPTGGTSFKDTSSYITVGTGIGPCLTV